MTESAFSPCRHDVPTSWTFDRPFDSMSDRLPISVFKRGVIPGLWTGAESRIRGEFKATLPEPDLIDVCTNPWPWCSTSEPRPVSRLIAPIYADVSEQVCRYLERHPNVLEILPDVAQQVGIHFHSDPKRRLHLEVLEEPEADQSELFVIIRSALEADRAALCLDRLLEEWFVDQAVVRAGLLAIVTEPLPTDD